MRQLTPLLVVAALFPGCNDKAAPSGQSVAAKGAATSAAGDETEALAAKLGPIIDCANRFTNRVLEIRSLYLGWAGDSGPTAETKAAQQFMQLTDPAPCIAQLGRAIAAPPQLTSLDAAAKAYGDTLAAVSAANKEAIDYYNQNRWKDDAFAKGIVLHARLTTAWEAFGTVASALDDAVAEANRRSHEAHLDRLEQTVGKKLEWQHGRLMLLAEDLAHVALTEFDRLDAAALESAITACEAAMNEWTAYLDAHKDEAATARAASSFESEGKATLKSAREILRAKKAATPPSPQDLSDLHKELLGDYNDFIDRSNMLFGR